MKEKFNNLYKVQKTLRFELKPMFETEQTIAKKELLKNDYRREAAYPEVKRLCDEAHRKFIRNVLEGYVFDKKNIEKYAALYRKGYKNLSKAEKDGSFALKKKMFSEIGEAFRAAGDVDKKYLKAPLIDEIIFRELSLTEEQKEKAGMFHGFTGYFAEYFTARELLYQGKYVKGSIAYRIIEENLPKFIDNISSFETIMEKAPEFGDCLTSIKEELGTLGDFEVQDLFTLDYFNFVLTQEGINTYNEVIGGRLLEKAPFKIRGLNEYINLYNQGHSRKDRLPMFTELYKQMLSDEETLSFRENRIETDNALIDMVTELVDNLPLDEARSFLKDLTEFNTEHIYLKDNESLTRMSLDITGKWRKFTSDVRARCVAEQGTFRTEKKEVDAWKKFSKERISLGELARCIEGGEDTVRDYFYGKIKDVANEIRRKYDSFLAEIERLDYSDGKKAIANDNKSANATRELLEATLKLDRLLKMLESREADKDMTFYPMLEELLKKTFPARGVYNKARNYMTKKPYSTQKTKLNFDSSTLGNGFGIANEPTNRTTFLLKDGMTYLAVLLDGKAFERLEDCAEETLHWKKMVYNQIPDASKYLSWRLMGTINPSEEMERLYKKKKSGEALSSTERAYYIDWIQNVFFEEYLPLRVGKKPDGEKYYDFSALRKGEEYATLQEFYADVETHAYSLTFRNISDEDVRQLVKEEKMLLFQLYNMDYSKYRNGGKKNLFTIYFEEAFNPENLNDKDGVKVRLKGGAELYRREASVKTPEYREAKGYHELQMKLQGNKYAHIKDFRYTEPKYFLHLVIGFNETSSDLKNISERTFNEATNSVLREKEDAKVIAVTRGKNHLINYCVMDCFGKIYEEGDFDTINGINHRNILLEKIGRMQEKKKSWSSVSNIKDAKKGYMSFVTHEITSLLMKYDGILAIESPDGGFGNKNQLENQIYQTLIGNLQTKLSFLVDKDVHMEKGAFAPGGTRNAYQFCLPESRNKFQNGLMFNVTSWRTRGIDPTTGFSNLFRFGNLDTKTERKIFLSRMKDISYDKEHDTFFFEFDYADYGITGLKQSRWTVSSEGGRVRRIKRIDTQKWYDVGYDATEALKQLFLENTVALSEHMLKDILDKDNDSFWGKFISAFKVIVSTEYEDMREDASFILSPVKNEKGRYYDSRKEGVDADVLAARLMARKGRMILDRIHGCPDETVTIGITAEDWWNEIQ
ncbi:MAG: type V CRISPR-associated protein Cas12a/Cpf1 [Lachnospiraceae bacterium]|nr:type V CRISPR-associated protein Cas12a/Cpf1 [Lachnospiraceae bacterium]